MAIDKKFIDKFSQVTSKAALAASYLVGRLALLYFQGGRVKLN